jgi:TonB family protein
MNRFAYALFCTILLTSGPALVFAEAASAQEPKLEVVSKAAPVYPAAAEANRIEGKGAAEAQVAPSGEVVAVTVLSETPEGSGFGEAVAAALKQYTFAPSPGGGRFRLTIAFTLPPAVEILQRADPVYPEAAAAAGITGEGTAIATVAPDGRVTATEPVSETPEGSGFAAATAEALSRTIFKPSEKGGRFRLTMTFTNNQAPAQ